jgi:RNase P subunit RPR2
MIRITKRGDIRIAPKYKGTCLKCKGEITATQEDIRAEDRPCSEPYVMCPTTGCGQRVYVKGICA